MIKKILASIAIMCLMFITFVAGFKYCEEGIMDYPHTTEEAVIININGGHVVAQRKSDNELFTAYTHSDNLSVGDSVNIVTYNSGFSCVKMDEGYDLTIVQWVLVILTWVILSAYIIHFFIKSEVRDV